VKDTKQQLHIGLNFNFSTLQLKYCTWLCVKRRP